MTDRLSPPVARLTVITLGVSDMHVSIAFYAALGFARKLRATGEEVAFFETGGAVLGLYPWSKLALDVTLPDQPRPAAFRGATLAWNCRTTAEVDMVLAFAVARGAALLKLRTRRITADIPDIFRTPTAIRGRWWLHPASRWAKIGGFICRIEAARRSP